MISWDYPFRLCKHVHIDVMMISTFKRTQFTKPNRLSNPYQKGEHISKLRGGGIFRFSSNFDRMFSAANNGDPDQMQMWHLIWVCPVFLRCPTKGH